MHPLITFFFCLKHVGGEGFEPKFYPMGEPGIHQIKFTNRNQIFHGCYIQRNYINKKTQLTNKSGSQYATYMNRKIIMSYDHIKCIS